METSRIPDLNTHLGPTENSELLMIDADLVSHIQRYVAEHPDLLILASEETEVLTSGVAARFLIDPHLRWWWQGVSEPRNISYGGQDGIRRLDQLLSNANGELVLVITDDEFPPWLGVSGTWSELRKLLERLRFFEFFVVDESASWIVFDTHQNCLVVVGEPDKSGPT